MSDTIRNYKGPDRIRKRPQIIFFRANYEGAIVLLLNLIDWSVQECLLGEATHVQVTKLEDGSFTISDDGAGLPIEGNDDFAGGWQEMFCGVYPQKEGEYIFSVGSERQHKLRATTGDDRFFVDQLTLFTACASCEFFGVQTYRDGFEFKLLFHRGVLEGDVSKKENRTGRGTKLCFKLDPEVFGNAVEFNFSEVVQYVAEQMAKYPGLIITVAEEIP